MGLLLGIRVTFWQNIRLLLRFKYTFVFDLSYFRVKIKVLNSPENLVPGEREQNFHLPGDPRGILHVGLCLSMAIYHYIAVIIDSFFITIF